MSFSISTTGIGHFILPKVYFGFVVPEEFSPNQRGEKREKNLAVRAVLLNFKSQYLFVVLPPLMPRISLFYICSCSVEEKHVQNDASLYVLCFKRNNYIF